MSRLPAHGALLVLLLAAPLSLAFASSPRAVTCNNTQKVVPAAGALAYQTFFRGFTSSSLEASNADEVNFEALDALATAMTGGADVGEVLVGVNQVAAAWNGSVASMQHLWPTTWWPRAVALQQRAEKLLEQGNTRRAAFLLHKATMYFQLGGRFSNHLSSTSLSMFNRSLYTFERAIGVDPSAANWCELTPIPYTDTTGSYKLHAYMCRPGSRSDPVEDHPTILAMGGYDSSSELTYHEVAALALSYGYNVLLFDGPGQGATARFERLLFRPDWEFVVKQVVDYALTLDGVNATSIALWGRSFGGYLTPRACAYEPRLRACVADGGVLDFYQGMLCDLPSSLQQLYMHDQDKFNRYMTLGSGQSLGLSFLLGFGKLGFNQTSPSDLYDTLSAYTNVGHLGGLTGRPVFINNPAFDTLMGNQSELFYAALPRPLSPATVLHTDNPQFGTALHCSVGSSDTTYTILDWLNTVL